MHAVHIWIAAIRPKTLIASIAPVLLAFCFSISQGYMKPLLLLYTLLTAICVQIGTNLANDYFDALHNADTPERVGPLRVTSAGLVSHKNMKIAISAAFLLSAFFSIFLIWEGGLVIAILGSIAISLGILYTGGPYPIAYLGLSEIFVLLFFGPIATGGTYYLQSGHYSIEAFLLGLSPGAFSCAILTMNNLRDHPQDEKAGKKTLVVRFGSLFGKIEYALCLILGVLIPLYFLFPQIYAFLGFAFLLPAGRLIQMVFSKEPSYNRLFPLTALFFTAYTFVLCQGFALL